ncbi:hypothetical protein KAR91_88535 [Candidatus Pacearchaeota archaeon]|nr:hypothetical protein [Candidatus Pacearchaeota archaeon]
MVDFKKFSEHQLRRLVTEYPNDASYPGAIERMILVIWNYLNERSSKSLEEYSKFLMEGSRKELKKLEEEERKRRAKIEAKERKHRVESIKKLKNWIVGIEDPIKLIETDGLLEWKCPKCSNLARFDLKEHIDSISKGDTVELVWYCSGKKSVDGPQHWNIFRQIRLAHGKEISRKLLEKEKKKTPKP